MKAVLRPDHFPRNRPRRLPIRLLAVVSGALLSFSVQASEPPFAITATQVLLVDDETGTVLFTKDANAPFAPASLAKLMTMEVVFEAIKSGSLHAEQSFTVSEHAWRTGGAPSGTSTMFAKIKSSLTVNDLIQGVVVQAANDGAIVLAEGLSGSEQAFALKMNQRASELGMTGSTFTNPTGLPVEGGAETQAVTMQDMVALSRHLYQAHPQYYPLYAQESFTWNNIMQRNRNPLLRLNIGADGLAMGGTKESGLSIIASAALNGRRVFLGLGGVKTAKDRAEEAEKLIRWAMDDFIKQPVFNAGSIVGQASIYGGGSGSVGMMVKLPVSVLMPKKDQGKLRAQLIYQGPLIAPVMQGQEIGTLQLFRDQELLLEQPVYAASAVEEGGLIQNAVDAFVELTTGWIRAYW